jgi:hypothetical protein
MITQKLRNRDTIEFLGLREQLSNLNFKPVEFDGFKKESGAIFLLYHLKKHLPKVLHHRGF